MKVDQLKNLIKEAVREAIQEELKDILLEAVRAPKTTVVETRQAAPTPMNGFGMTSSPNAFQPTNTPTTVPNRLSSNALQEMLAQTKASMNPVESRNLLEMGSSVGNVDLVNGRLPEGEVSMDTIMKLVKR